jgi:predicted nucleotidyltransferase component of viral defense system
MIQQRDLSIISNRLLKENGGRRIPEKTIELDYALGWFLAELAQHAFGDKLAFKGGTALRRCHIGEYRFSEDLDFTLLNDDVKFEQIQVAFEEVASKVKDRTGMDFQFGTPDRTPHRNSHTFTMRFTGPMRAEREFKVDITIAECIVGELERKTVLRTYDVFDFPEGASVKCYSLAEIVVEKLVALTDKQRTQPRDLYDLWYMTAEGHVDISTLATAVAKKLDFRQRSAEGLLEIFKGKKAALERTWKTRLDPQMAEIPEFESVFREVERLIRQSNVFDDALKIQRQV